MSQAMVLANEVGITSMRELQDLARVAAASKLFNFTPEQALMLMMTGRDLGFSYAQSMRMFYLVNGKPTLSADAMVAVCLSHKDVCEYFVNVSTDDKQSTWETKRVGTPGPQRYTFTIKLMPAARSSIQSFLDEMSSETPRRSSSEIRPSSISSI